MQAIVITAYKDYDHLVNLLKTATQNFRVYVHVDKKSLELTEKLQNIHMENLCCFSTYSIPWGGVKHLFAITDMLRAILKEKDINYVHIISGQDDIVRPYEDFKSFEQSQKIYMTCSGQDKFSEDVLKRLACPVFFSNIDSRKKFFRVMYEIEWRFLKIFHLQRKKLGKFDTIYKGMIWASMPISAVNYLINYIDTHADFWKSMKHTIIPEEFFF